MGGEWHRIVHLYVSCLLLVFDVRYGQHDCWLCVFVDAACTTIGYTGTAGSCTCADGYAGTVTYDVATGATSGCTGKRIARGRNTHSFGM